MTEKLARLLMRVRPIELAEAVKQLCRVQRAEIDVGNLKFWLDPVSNLSRNLLGTGGYERDFTQRLLEILEPGDVFVDVGANEGYFSVLAADRVGPGGHVFALEPQMRLWPIIINNFIINTLRNYTLIPYAVGTENGFIELILHPSLNTGSSTLVNDNRRRFLPRQKAGITTLSEVVAAHDIGKVKLLKIDVEGYELFALKGGAEWLRSGAVQNILVEFHPAQLQRLGHSKRDVEDLLLACGFTRLSEGGFEHWQRSI